MRLQPARRHIYEPRPGLPSTRRLQLKRDAIYSPRQATSAALGMRPREVHEPKRAVLDNYLGYPGSQAAWDFRKSYFHVAFRTSVEARIAAVRSAGLVCYLYGRRASHDPRVSRP